MTVPTASLTWKTTTESKILPPKRRRAVGRPLAIFRSRADRSAINEKKKSTVDFIKQIHKFTSSMLF